MTSLAKIDVAVHEIENVTAEQNPATAHLFIINPRSGERMDNLFSTHPSTENRIAALEQLAAQMGVIRALYIRCATPKPTESPSCLFGFADLLGHLLCRLLRLLCNAEVFEFFSGFDCCRAPARRQSAPGPCFARICRFAEFWGT